MYAINPRTMVGNQTCVKEIIGGYEISIAFDNSCGACFHNTRSDIRVFGIGKNENVDYTSLMPEELWGDNDIIIGTIENLIIVYNWCLSH